MATGLIGSVLGTLDPTKGDGIVDKLGPLIVVGVWAIVTGALALGLVPASGAATSAYGLLSAFAGGFLRHAAPSAASAAPASP